LIQNKTVRKTLDLKTEEMGGQAARIGLMKYKGKGKVVPVLN